jgi:hypothetical protein
VPLVLRFFGTEIGLMWVEVFVFASRQKARVGIVFGAKKDLQMREDLCF